jgi:hypothetical protein
MTRRPGPGEVPQRSVTELLIDVKIVDGRRNIAINFVRHAAFALRFPIEEVPQWATRYGYLGPETERLETIVGPRSRQAGLITKPDFLDICEWKSVRQRPRYAANSAELIEEATRIALSARDERIRIGVLLPLRGVGWPVASTLLYFAHRDPYPILDFRALWSLGVDKPPFVFDFAYWSAYVAACRRTAAAAGVAVRQLDRAVWQYSNNQVR